METKKTKSKPAENKQGQMIAVIRVKGVTQMRHAVENTLQLMRLYRKNFCAVLESNDITTGMLRQAKDKITWGEIDDATFNEMVSKRGEEYTGRLADSKELYKYNEFVEINGKKIKKYFRLNAPRHGYARKGIKTTVKQGGALGYRGAAINDLIKRML
jgi:large subunit ribosomal protein L30